VSHVTTPADFPYPWYMRLIFRRQRQRYGQTLEPVRLWGRIPGAFPAMSLLYRRLERKRSRIEPPLRSLVQVLVSQINGCEFCDDLNSSLGLDRGVALEKLRQLPHYEDSDAFSEREKSALRYADAVTRSDRRVDAALVSALRGHFDDQGIVELAALIAYQNMSSKFNVALGVPAHGFCAASLHSPAKRAS
jgi:AhpD family alkylhydroperoxidase